MSKKKHRKPQPEKRIMKDMKELHADDLTDLREQIEHGEKGIPAGQAPQLKGEIKFDPIIRSGGSVLRTREIEDKSHFLDGPEEAEVEGFLDDPETEEDLTFFDDPADEEDFLDEEDPPEEAEGREGEETPQKKESAEEAPAEEETSEGPDDEENAGDASGDAEEEAGEEEEPEDEEDLQSRLENITDEGEQSDLHSQLSNLPDSRKRKPGQGPQTLTALNSQQVNEALKNAEMKEIGAEEGEAAAKKKHSKLLWIIPLCLVALLAGAYGGAVYYFHTHFGFHTTINGVDCSFKSVGEVEDIVKEQVSDYSIVVHARESEDCVLRGDAFELKYVDDDQIENILASQDYILWPKRIWETEEASTMHATVEVDDAKFEAAVNKLPFMKEENMRAPVDSKIEFDGEKYIVTEEDYGTTVIPEEIYKLIKEAVVSTVDDVDVNQEQCYVKPKKTHDDEGLNKTVDTYNQVATLSITYEFGDKTEVLDGSTTIKWFTFEDDGTYTIDEEAIKEWLRDMGKRHDTIGTARSFVGADGGSYEVDGGNYGWELDEAAEFDEIMAMFENKKSAKREPIYVRRAAAFVPQGEPDWGNTYIDLNLSKQHMWYVKDGEIVFEADVVTGLPTPKRTTPDGVFQILEMKQNKVLRGDRLPDGTYEYETPVAYWMRITWSGVGFHTATWQPYFGGELYKWNGSHGCINMSYKDSQTLYGLVEVGLPVISHY